MFTFLFLIHMELVVIQISYVEIWTEAKHNPRHAYLKPTTSIALLCNNLVYELIYVLSFSSFKKYKHRVVPVYPNMDI